MVRVGGFLKTQNRIRRQRASGRFISPYQVGGTIFGKSVMSRYPLMHTSSRMLEPWKRMQRQRRKMKGGTIVGQYPESIQWARTMARARAKRRKMKGGTIFGTSTRMRVGDPMKVLRADQEKAMMDRWIRQRKSIKRRRR